MDQGLGRGGGGTRKGSKTKHVSRENAKPDKRRGLGLPNPWDHPRKGDPPVSCCMLQERKRQRPGQSEGLHSNQSHCLCLLSVWEKRQVSTPKTTMSSPSPPQTQALDQQRSTKATFHIQSGKSAHLSQTQHHQGCTGALGHELAVPITITRNADKAISTLPEQLLLSPRFPGLWLQIGIVLQSLPQALVSSAQ